MALIDKASLLMVPSTYEAGTLYNVLPSGNRAPDSTDQNSGYDQTRADFTFDRGTDHGATRIGSDGLIKKYRENLLLRSNSFSSFPTWSLTSALINGGQTGYDGSSNAWLLSKSAAAGRILQSVSNTGVLTFSFYASSGTLDYVATNCGSVSSSTTYFDLLNGVVGTISANTISASIEQVGATGWYRCSATFNVPSSAEYRIYPADSASSVGSGTSGNIYIQNAQLESGTIATDYLNSTSVTGKAGVLIDLPRIDYSSGAGALLLEPQRANYEVNSESFTNWTNGGDGVTLSVNTSDTLDPSGYYGATKVTTTGGNRRIYDVTGIPAGTSTYSVFVKAGTGQIFRLFTSNNAFLVDFNLITQEITETIGSGTIKSYGNGWYRCTATGTTPSGDVIQFIFPNNNNETIYIWGAQFEAGSYATSYIPNHGETGGVTRAADSCSVTGASDVIGQTEGTLYMDFTFDGHFDAFAEFGIFASLANRYALYTYDSTNTLRGYLIASNSTIFETNVSDALVVGQRYKAAFAVKSGEIAVYINGESKYTNTGTFSFNESLDEYKFSAYGGVTKWNQKTHQTIVFNERLTNEELATLTTL